MKKASRRQQGQQRHQRAVARRRQVAAKRATQPARIWAGRDVETLCTEATALGYLGEFDEAYAMLDAVKRRWPTYPNYRPELGYLRYLQGDLSPETFRLLRGDREGRPRVPGLAAYDRAKIPLWDGQPIPGQSLLVWSDPGGFGYGDIIQHARLLPAVQDQSQAHLTVGLPPGLSPLFQGLPGVDVWVNTPLSDLGGYTAHVPFEWLPVVCELTPAILQGCPYLSAEPALVEQWRPTFANQAVCHLGLHWQADTAHRNAKWRALMVDDLAPLFTLPRTRWYSLQKGGGAALATYPQITDLGEIDTPDAKFVQTAAVVSLLDAVVCIDSSIAHVCGAMNHRAYVLLAAMADPQWSVDTSSAAWYPSLRVRRARPQPGARDMHEVLWADLVTRVRDEIARAVETTLATG